MSKIELAKPKDIKGILSVFEKCTKVLLAANIYQWDGTYPSREIFGEDIKNNCVFIVKEGKNILATITLNDQQDEQYSSINWKFKEDKALIIHRLAVAPEAQGKGLGKELCEFSESFGLKNRFKIIRLDAYSGNPTSCRLYEKLNYQKAEGFCWFHGNELPFFCYEKQISNDT